MQTRLAHKREVYEVVSRLIVGGRVYLPGNSVELDTSEGEVLRLRGFVRPPKTVVAAHEPNVEKEPPLRPGEVGIVTKDEQSAQMEQPNPPAPGPNNVREEAPNLPKEPTNGKASRKNR